jgi:3-dehydrosphinganine reductase
LYIPAGILSPGYEEEEKTKPAVTRKIEDGDTPMKPEECVGNLIAGETFLVAHMGIETDFDPSV